MAAVANNMFSNQFSISFPIMSCYLLKVTKILYSNLESSTRVSSALVNCSVLLLGFCDAAALILSTVFYLLKQVQNDNCSYNCVDDSVV